MHAKIIYHVKIPIKQVERKLKRSETTQQENCIFQRTIEFIKWGFYIFTHNMLNKWNQNTIIVTIITVNKNIMPKN